jgi:uncharacterized membrane protein
MAGDEEELPSASAAEHRHRPPRGIAGEDLGRILALSDGVFAFALTLLALSLTVPYIDPNGLTHSQVSNMLAAALRNDYNAFLGYVFAFVMIAIWWVNHNRTFQYIARYNQTLVWANMAILLQIAVMPFVLSVYNSYSYTQVAVDLFAGFQVTLGLTATMLWDYARRAKLLKPTVPHDVATYFTRRGLLLSAVFAVSIGLSFLTITGAEISWFGALIVQRFVPGHQG